MARQFKPGQLQTGSLYNISSSYAVTASYATNAGVSIDTGSLVATSSFNAFTASYATGSFTGSFIGTLSGTATTASYALYAVSASYEINYETSSSYAETASVAINALTASYVNPLQQNVIITGSIYLPDNTHSIYFSGSNAASRLTWNNTDGTLDLGLKGGNVTLQIGQETVVRVVNKTGADLLESQYKTVRIRSVAEGGAQGQRLAIVLAQADNDANSATTIGIVTENISNNQEGFITTFGLVRDINTTGALQGETWVDGDMLYLSPTTPGSITNIKPQAPDHMIVLGYVVYAHANQGKIFVKVDNGYEIDELHNVKITTSSLQSGQVLVRSGSVWINTNQLTGSYGLTGSLTATSFTGSLLGTASYSTQALSASFAPSTPAFPYTGSALITGSLGVTGSASILAYTSSAVKIFNVRNSANTYDIISSYGSELTIIGRNESTEPRLLVDRLGSTRMLLGGTTDLNITFPSSGYGQINTGTQGLDVIATSGDIRTRNSSTSTILKGNFFGIGQATPAARLDIAAQGALSTDLALRIRNSADNDNILTVKGDMSIQLLGSGSGGYLNLSRPSGAGANVRLIHRGTATLPSNFIIGSYGDGGSIGQIILDAFAGDGTTPTFTTQRLISGLSDLSGSALYTGFGSNAATFVMKNALNYVGYGVNPTGTATDHFAMYSADIAAGTASAHFRNEAGHIVKLYTQSPVTSSQGIADVLTNLGFLTGSSIINPTASYATTASYSVSASYAPDTTFPYTGSALITGSLTVTGSIYTDSIIYSPFTIGLNFETATSYTYKTPYAFKVNSIESDPSGSLTMIYQASGSTEVTSSYIIGDVINKFDKLIITPATASLIVLNSIRI